MNDLLTALPDLRPNPDWARLPLFDKRDWQPVRFGDVVENLNETCDPESAGVDRFIGLEHLDPGSLHVTRWGNVTDGTTFTRRCRPGQVLFGKRRAYQRKVAVAEFDAVVSGDIYVLAPKGDRLLGDLLPFLCLSEGFFRFAVDTSAGSLSPRTSWAHLAQFIFALPSIESQVRFAPALSELEALRRHQFALANSGRVLLNAQSRDYFGRESTTAESLGNLIGRGVASLQTGPFGTMLAAASYAESGVPVVNPVNMNGDDFDVSSGPFVSNSEAQRLARFKIEPADIVICRKRHVGRMVLAHESHSGFILGSDCIRLRFAPSVAWVNSCLRSCAAQRCRLG